MVISFIRFICHSPAFSAGYPLHMTLTDSGFRHGNPEGLLATDVPFIMPRVLNVNINYFQCVIKKMGCNAP
jgi:hypothetical protein